MPSRLRDIREVTRTEVLATKSSRDVARDATRRDPYPVPERSFNCSRGSTSILREHEPTNARVCELQEPVQTHMPKLRYADITQPISMIFPRVNLKKLLEAEDEVWESSEPLEIPNDVQCQMSCLAHKHAVRALVERGKDPSTIHCGIYTYHGAHDSTDEKGCGTLLRLASVWGIALLTRPKYIQDISLADTRSCGVHNNLEIIARREISPAINQTCWRRRTSSPSSRRGSLWCRNHEETEKIWEGRAFPSFCKSSWEAGGRRLSGVDNNLYNEKGGWRPLSSSNSGMSWGETHDETSKIWGGGVAPSQQIESSFWNDGSTTCRWETSSTSIREYSEDVREQASPSNRIDSWLRNHERYKFRGGRGSPSYRIKSSRIDDPWEGRDTSPFTNTEVHASRPLDVVEIRMASRRPRPMSPITPSFNMWW